MGTGGCTILSNVFLKTMARRSPTAAPKAVPKAPPKGTGEASKRLLDDVNAKLKRVDAMKQELSAALAEEALVPGVDVREKVAAPILALARQLQAVYGRVSGSVESMTSEERAWLGDAIEAAMRRIAERYASEAPRRERPEGEQPAIIQLAADDVALRQKVAKHNKDLTLLGNKADAHYLGSDLNDHIRVFVSAVSKETRRLVKDAKDELAKPVLVAVRQETARTVESLSLPRFADKRPRAMGADLAWMLGDSRKFVSDRLKRSYAKRRKVSPREYVTSNIRLVEGHQAPTAPAYIKFQMDWLSVCVSDDNWPQYVFCLKSSRVGWSTTLVEALVYNCDERKLPQLMFLPTDDRVSEFSKNSLAPVVDNGPLRDLADEEKRGRGSGDHRHKRQDNMYVKRYDGIPIMIRASRSPANLLQTTSDVLIVDEVDSCYVEGSEYSAFHEEALRAIRGAGHSRAIFGGTISDRQLGFIKERADNAAFRFRYYVPCPHCGKHQTLKWDTSADRTSGFFWKGRKADDDDSDLVRQQRAETVRYVGECCGKPWTWADYKGVSNEGHWGTDDGHRLDTSGRLPVVWDAKGEKARWRISCSFTIWSAYSFYESWSSLVYRWLSVQGDRESMATFYRTYLAQEFADGDAALEPDEIAARNSYALLPPWIEYLTCGADVQADKTVWCVFGWGTKKQKCCFVERREFHGKDTVAANDNAWVEAAKWLNDVPTWKNEKGEAFDIQWLFLDQGGNPERIKSFLRETLVHPWNAYPIYGLDSKDSGRLKRPLITRKKERGSLRTRTLETYTLKNIVAAKLTAPREEEAFCWIHTPQSGIGRQAFDELASERRGWEGTGKAKRRSWKPKSSHRPNETFDCLVYAYAALMDAAPPFFQLTPADVLDDDTLQKRLDEAERKGMFAQEKPKAKPKEKPAQETPNKPKAKRKRRAAVKPYLGAFVPRRKPVKPKRPTGGAGEKPTADTAQGNMVNAKVEPVQEAQETPEAATWEELGLDLDEF